MNHKLRRLYKKLLYKSVWLIFLPLLIAAFYKIEQNLIYVDLPKSEGVVKIYANQVRDDLRSTFSRAISEAKESVLLIVFTLHDPQIIQALRKKSEEGASVRVICDARISNETIRKLGKKVSVVKIQGKNHMHLKILVVDDEQTWIGSSNMTTDSLRMFGNLVVGFVHPQFAEMVTQKAEQLITNNGTVIPMQEFLVGDQRIEFWFLPDNSNGVKRVIQLLDEAKKSIRVAMFMWTRKDLAWAVINAYRRGVHVDVVMDEKSAKGAASGVVFLLKTNNTPVSLSLPGPMLHHKFAYIDEKILINGSANWTYSAFNVNEDCFIVIFDLTPEQQDKLNRLWSVIKLDSAPA